MFAFPRCLLQHFQANSHLIFPTESPNTLPTHTHTPEKMRPERSGGRSFKAFPKISIAKAGFFSPCFLNKARQKNCWSLFYLLLLDFFANWVWCTLSGSPQFPVKGEVLLAYVYGERKKTCVHVSAERCYTNHARRVSFFYLLLRAPGIYPCVNNHTRGLRAALTFTLGPTKMVNCLFSGAFASLIES